MCEADSRLQEMSRTEGLIWLLPANTPRFKGPSPNLPSPWRTRPGKRFRTNETKDQFLQAQSTADLYEEGNHLFKGFLRCNEPVKQVSKTCFSQFINYSTHS